MLFLLFQFLNQKTDSTKCISCYLLTKINNFIKHRFKYYQFDAASFLRVTCEYIMSAIAEIAPIPTK